MPTGNTPTGKNKPPAGHQPDDPQSIITSNPAPSKKHPAPKTQHPASSKQQAPNDQYTKTTSHHCCKGLRYHSTKILHCYSTTVL
ncbi:hypothetical protein B484DRAFT_444595 [Ochromonadaceae sp. CCMP2298]|nr:hypothetical protein B484DRAFT_444595 [Ochromonadaceae sp. CCMP2298]